MKKIPLIAALAIAGPAQTLAGEVQRFSKLIKAKRITAN